MIKCENCGVTRYLKLEESLGAVLNCLKANWIYVSFIDCSTFPIRQHKFISWSLFVTVVSFALFFFSPIKLRDYEYPRIYFIHPAKLTAGRLPYPVPFHLNLVPVSTVCSILTVVHKFLSSRFLLLVIFQAIVSCNSMRPGKGVVSFHRHRQSCVSKCVMNSIWGVLWKISEHVSVSIGLRRLRRDCVWLIWWTHQYSCI